MMVTFFQFSGCFDVECLFILPQEFPGGIGSMSQGTFTIDPSIGGEVRGCWSLRQLRWEQ